MGTHSAGDGRRVHDEEAANTRQAEFRVDNPTHGHCTVQVPYGVGGVGHSRVEVRVGVAQGDPAGELVGRGRVGALRADGAAGGELVALGAIPSFAVMASMRPSLGTVAGTAQSMG